MATRKRWRGENREKVRTYGQWPSGDWPRVGAHRIVAVRVSPTRSGDFHPDGGPAAEIEIVYELKTDRQSLVLDHPQTMKLFAMLRQVWQTSGAKEPVLDQPPIIA
jgi:hypothetical protein